MEYGRMPWRKCRKKPVVVEFREPQTTKHGKTETIDTLEGVLLAEKGKHYIIRGTRGELYPIEIEIFYETYEILE